MVLLRLELLNRLRAKLLLRSTLRILDPSLESSSKKDTMLFRSTVTLREESSEPEKIKCFCLTVWKGTKRRSTLGPHQLLGFFNENDIFLIISQFLLALRFAR